MRRPTALALTVVAGLAFAAAPGAAQLSLQPTGKPIPQTGLPEPLKDVGFEQRIGSNLPLDARFADHEGREVRLGDALDGRPAILALVYYDCPMLCSLVLDGLVRGLKPLSFDPGEQFQVVVVSFDSAEKPAQAAEVRDVTLERMGRPGTEDGWTFLTGDADAVDRLTEAVGFSYELDEESGEFAHAAGIVITTPRGRLARYFYGVEYSSRDLRLGLVEAADGKLGNLVDTALLYCFRYDPDTGSYTTITMNLVRLGGVATLLALGAFLTTSLRRERRLKSA